MREILTAHYEELLVSERARGAYVFPLLLLPRSGGAGSENLARGAAVPRFRGPRDTGARGCVATCTEKNYRLHAAAGAVQESARSRRDHVLGATRHNHLLASASLAHLEMETGAAIPRLGGKGGLRTFFA